MKNIMLIICKITNGGAEHSIVKLANELSKNNNVILLVENNSNHDYKCNVKTIEIPELRYKRKIIQNIHKLKKIKNKYQIDTTISYTTKYNFYNVLSHRKDKTIISVRNHLSTKKEGLFNEIMNMISAKLCNKIVCCSESVKQDQINYFHAKENKITVIPNFFDPNYINNELNKDLSKEDKLLIKNKKIIISIARLTPHKGQRHIIKAMSIVTKKVPEACLLIFGRGEELEKLKLLVKQYNLDNNVIFMGFRKDHYKFLKKSKCLVLTSYYEGFPNVLIESLACSTPIVASDSPGGNKEIIKDNKYGILLEDFQKDKNKLELTNLEEKLAEEITKLCTDEKYYSYYKKQASIRAKEYTNKKVMKQWLNII